MATATGLKPPPKFVTNEWAWSHALRKLALKGMLDEHGNPKNYGAAIAIYKASCKKYPHETVDLPPANSWASLPGAGKREDFLDLDIGGWFGSRGMLFAADDDRTIVLRVQQVEREARSPHDPQKRVLEPLWYWRALENDGTQHTFSVPASTVLWLVRDHAPAVAFARDLMNSALAGLYDLRDEVHEHRRDVEQDGVPTFTIGDSDPFTGAFFDFEATVKAIDARVAEFESAVRS